MTTYNWELIERLLHEVQNSAGHNFAPRVPNNMPRPRRRPVSRRAILTSSRPRRPITSGCCSRTASSPRGRKRRGSSLLSLIDSSIPGHEHPRWVLDEQQDALDPQVFDELASKAQIA